jgi:hypothetical protein
MVQLKYTAALYRMVCHQENILYAFTKYGCHTIQPHVNNLGLNLATIQLIIPNKQGLIYSENSIIQIQSWGEVEVKL